MSAYWATTYRTKCYICGQKGNTPMYKNLKRTPSNMFNTPTKKSKVNSKWFLPTLTHWT